MGTCHKQGCIQHQCQPGPFLCVNQQVTREVQIPRGPPVPDWALQEDTLVRAPFKAEKGIIERNAIFSLNHLYLLLWVLPKLGKLLLWSQLPP